MVLNYLGGRGVPATAIDSRFQGEDRWQPKGKLLLFRLDSRFTSRTTRWKGIFLMSRLVDFWSSIISLLTLDPGFPGLFFGGDFCRTIFYFWKFSLYFQKIILLNLLIFWKKGRYVLLSESSLRLTGLAGSLRFLYLPNLENFFLVRQPGSSVQMVWSRAGRLIQSQRARHF